MRIQEVENCISCQFNTNDVFCSLVYEEISHDGKMVYACKKIHNPYDKKGIPKWCPLPKANVETSNIINRFKRIMNSNVDL